MKRIKPLLTCFTFVIYLSVLPISVTAQENQHPKESTWKGFKRIDFQFQNRNARIVIPEKAAAGKPWLWRARFPDWHTDADSILIAHGFHLVYVNTDGLLGSPQAMKVWDDFYSHIRTTYDLQAKVALVGVSRGGLFVYNWAKRNPGKVSCIYAEAPVCDIKSWPGGKGKGPGSKKEWTAFLKDYGYQTDEQAAPFAGSPINKISEIVKGGYPMLHVCGDMDEVVPMSENTLPFAEKIKQAGGNISIIHKPEGKHHPHSLANPQPIVDFILKAAQK